MKSENTPPSPVRKASSWLAHHRSSHVEQTANGWEGRNVVLLEVLLLISRLFRVHFNSMANIWNVQTEECVCEKSIWIVLQGNASLRRTSLMPTPSSLTWDTTSPTLPCVSDVIMATAWSEDRAPYTAGTASGPSWRWYVKVCGFFHSIFLVLVIL